MSKGKDSIQGQYNATCARLGELIYRQTALEAEKESLIKQLAELQKAWTTIAALEAQTVEATNEPVAG